MELSLIVFDIPGTVVSDDDDAIGGALHRAPAAIGGDVPLAAIDSDLLSVLPGAGR